MVNGISKFRIKWQRLKLNNFSMPRYLILRIILETGVIMNKEDSNILSHSNYFKVNGLLFIVSENTMLLMPFMKGLKKLLGVSVLLFKSLSGLKFKEIKIPKITKKLLCRMLTLRHAR